MEDTSKVSGVFCTIDGEEYCKITNVNEIDPFLMSVVSDSNHWMFISSNGALTAGRVNIEFSLFPYYSDDKITESTEVTGCKTLIRVATENGTLLWEPFSIRGEGCFSVSRNLYKNTCSNKIIFEEINYSLGLIFRYSWNTSNRYGFVRKSSIENISDECREISLVDGFLNIMPYGVPNALQVNTSNLADAYKRSELIKESGLGIFALSAIIVDKAEPSEALRANIVWSKGLDNAIHLLSSNQLHTFRKGGNLTEESDIKGQKGCYFVASSFCLPAKAQKQWYIVADTNRDHSSIVALSAKIRNDKEIVQSLQEDIDLGTEKLKKLLSSADGYQLTTDKKRNARHLSNTLFNIMRGGIFDNNYQIEKWDFSLYLANANRQVLEQEKKTLESLPEVFGVTVLMETAEQSANADFMRLCTEYLPLMFSRRHGDPSRPWNRFSINTTKEDGSKILDYEGNWRDIFQNWEALALSYPEFLNGMIYKFLNATTFDGYNPYRVTKGGFDWETIEKDNPWSYIGYWGDHQIIYLLKLLELSENYHPGKLQDFFTKEVFVYANVPYRIKPYEKILLNAKDTIVYDFDVDKAIALNRGKIGADATLLKNSANSIHRVNFIEKILATSLAKLSNFIPEAGIWMNTQRPEWNDANNALVGNGVSMVTLCYLRRFLLFFENLFTQAPSVDIQVSEEMADFFSKIAAAFENNKDILNSPISDADRKSILDQLEIPASEYRTTIYANSFSGTLARISTESIKHFYQTAIQYLEHSIRANKRADNLYHSYNLMSVIVNEVKISHLSEMLEGQVAALSSGYLTPMQSADLLDGLRHSKLYRQDQNSYILYPNNELPKFLEKNNIPESSVAKSELLKVLVSEGNTRIIDRDIEGNYHFNGYFKNAGDLQWAMENLGVHTALVEKEKHLVLGIFEETFNHKAFTGRSGSFYGYEGLGSIYWHMVSKLLLAVEESCIRAIKESANETAKEDANQKANDNAIDRLKAHYYDICEGIGVHKSPALYGAFPTDPYSHTPFGKGARQPGMTGQVKEDILSRQGELGLFVNRGELHFLPVLLKKEEFLKEDAIFEYVDVEGNKCSLPVPANSLCFTFCQIPIVYRLSADKHLEITLKDGEIQKIAGLSLDSAWSQEIFGRTSRIKQLTVFLEI